MHGLRTRFTKLKGLYDYFTDTGTQLGNSNIRTVCGAQCRIHVIACM